MKILSSKLLKHVYVCAFVLALLPAVAIAQDDAAVDILPARTLSDDMMTVTNNDATHPAIKLTPDKSELVRLEREAGTVVVGNPAHLSVLIDTSKTLVLVPKMPGATHFTVLDGKGGVIMQRHVIVGSPKEHYVRVRRACAGGGSDCQQTSVFYCPDMCHQVNVTQQPGSGASQAPGEGLAKTAANSEAEPHEEEEAPAEAEETSVEEETAE